MSVSYTHLDVYKRQGLWQEIDAFTKQLTSTTQMEDIKHQPVIFATREAYKRCGPIYLSSLSPSPR